MYCLCHIHLIILLLLERENQRVSVDLRSKATFLFFLCYFFFSLDENFLKMIIFFCPKIFNFFEIYYLTCENSIYRSPKNWAFSNRKSDFLPKNHVFEKPKHEVLSELLSWLEGCDSLISLLSLTSKEPCGKQGDWEGSEANDRLRSKTANHCQKALCS